MAKIIGCLVLIRIPEIEFPYVEIDEIATKANFDRDYAPKQPNKINAWRKATNLGAAGRKIEPPMNKQTATHFKYGASPKVRLHTKIISDNAPLLIRHIVRTVAIPTTNISGDKRKVADTQLDSSTVCIMEFDTVAETMTSTSQAELDDQNGWVDMDLRQVVQGLHDRTRIEVETANSSEVRNGIRSWLFDNNATLMTSGGAYFIPNRDEIQAELKAVKKYLESLVLYQADLSARPPQMMIITLNDDESGSLADLSENVIHHFKTRLQTLANELQPIIGDGNASTRSEPVSDKIRQRITTRYLEIQTAVKEYQAVLGEELSGLETYLAGMGNLIIEAQRINCYKARKELKDDRLEREK